MSSTSYGQLVGQPENGTIAEQNRCPTQRNIRVYLKITYKMVKLLIFIPLFQ